MHYKPSPCNKACYKACNFAVYWSYHSFKAHHMHPHSCPNRVGSARRRYILLERGPNTTRNGVTQLGRLKLVRYHKDNPGIPGQREEQIRIRRLARNQATGAVNRTLLSTLLMRSKRESLMKRWFPNGTERPRLRVKRAERIAADADLTPAELSKGRLQKPLRYVRHEMLAQTDASGAKP